MDVSLTHCLEISFRDGSLGALKRFGARWDATKAFWYPRQESNLDLRFRKPLFYPLNYGDSIWSEPESPAPWNGATSSIGGLFAQARCVIE